MHILLVDNSGGSHPGPLTSQLCEKLRTYGEVACCNVPTGGECVLDRRWDAVVLSGSAVNLTEPVLPGTLSKDFAALLHFPHVPVLGVCFGMQLMALAYGGHVERRATRAHGSRMTESLPPLGAPRVLEGRFLAHFEHGDVVTRVPPRFATVARHDGAVDAMESQELLRFGVQYHPERSPAAPTLRRFFEFVRARAPGLRAAVPETEMVGGRPLSWASVRHIEHMLGRMRPARLAELHSIPTRSVEAIWYAFRARYRIPAMLL